MEHLQDILNKVDAILQEEKKRRKSKKQAGEHFNIFPILRKSHDEVGLHSAFIAELLNPKGSHGQGDAFLKIFIDKFCNDKNFNTKESEVSVEHYIGEINKDKTKGGRIDILIKNKNGCIIVENKIYAPDQENQLLRYENFAKNEKIEYQIFYLNLHKKPSNERDVESTPISYKDDIFSWLNDCLELVSSKEQIKNIINQYLNVIKQLTGYMEPKEIKKIADIINEDETGKNFMSFFAMQQNADEIKKEVVLKRLTPQFEEIAEKNKLKFESIDLEKFSRKEKYFKFRFINPKWDYCCINFEYLNPNFNYMFYGISYINDETRLNNGILSEIKEKIKEDSTWGENPWYLFAKDVDEKYQNWNQAEFWEDLFNGKFAVYIDSRIKELLKKTENFKF